MARNDREQSSISLAKKPLGVSAVKYLANHGAAYTSRGVWHCHLLYNEAGKLTTSLKGFQTTR